MSPAENLMVKGEQHQERGAERERERGIGSYLLWVFVALAAYILSVGPDLLLL